MAPLYLASLNGGPAWSQGPNDVPGSALSGVFGCLGEDEWIAVDLEDPADVAAACALLELGDIDADGHDATTALRTALTGWCAGRHAIPGDAKAQRAIAAAVVENLEDLWRDPQLPVVGFTATWSIPTSVAGSCPPRPIKSRSDCLARPGPVPAWALIRRRSCRTGWACATRKSATLRIWKPAGVRRRTMTFALSTGRPRAATTRSVARHDLPLRDLRALDEDDRAHHPNGPKTRNAQNRGLLVELDDAFATAEADDTVRVVILAAAGPISRRAMTWAHRRL